MNVLFSKTFTCYEKEIILSGFYSFLFFEIESKTANIRFFNYRKNNNLIKPKLSFQV